MTFTLIIDDHGRVPSAEGCQGDETSRRSCQKFRGVARDDAHLPWSVQAYYQTEPPRG